ncbi:sensor histidine kinase [Kribbella deserti]|uniref:histidine kinase n=1 Tax=Kribbella deserti TaxID=1926257 RepID=A0ABV6QP98_9ACTN
MAEDQNRPSARGLDVALSPKAARAAATCREWTRTYATTRGWWMGPDAAQRANHLVTACFPVAIAWTSFRHDSPHGWLVLVSGLLQSTALMFGRRYPLAVVIVVGLVDLVLTALGGYVLAFGVVIGVYYAACWADRRGLRMALAAAATYLTVLTVLAIDEQGGLPLIALTVIGLAGFTFSGRFEASQRQRITELRETSTRLVEERAVAEQRAADRERALLARELHDILNHSVTRMVLDAEAGAETGDEAAARQTLRRVADTGRDSLAELRRLLGVLRTDGPDELRPPPTLAELDELVARIPAGGPQVTIERHGPVRTADTSIELAAYRVVQESLTNVAKHAGGVPTIVRLTYLPGSLEIEVSNQLPDPPAPTDAVRGTGLVGMRERVELLGGTVHAGTHDGGFAVYATLPLRQPVRSGEPA